MRRLLKLTWIRLCNLLMVPQPAHISLRDKAIAVAGRVSAVKVKGTMQVCCPVCSELIFTSVDSDLKMILAVHLSLWHPEDVKLQWDIMHSKKESVLHVPSLILGVGIAAGCGALLAFAAKNKARAPVSKTERLPRFKGHAAPLIKLSNRICKLGVKVTFVTTEFILAKMASSMPASDEEEGNRIRLVSVPDGLESDIDRKDQKKMTMSIYKLMPAQLEGLLNKANNTNNAAERYTGVIFDSPLSFLLEIPKKMGIKCATYWCSTSGCLALGVNIEKLLEAKVIDAIDGAPLKNDEKVQLVPDMPAMSPAEFTWCFPADLEQQRAMFHYIKSIVNNMIIKSDWILCNWFNDLDTGGSSLLPNLLAVGPLLADGMSAGSFVSEDSSCLSWLDNQSPGSVIYVAFGSTSRFSQEQIKEIALGLELIDKPFLWVAWSGLTNGTSLTFPDGFTERVANRGKIVDWAPQERVLAHPSIGCFISHCGWGSFMESLSMGVPFLCWPYFGDQLYTQTCICEAWKVGLWLNADENGIISGNEIKHKVDNLFSDINIRSNALKLKEMARKSISEGGSSYKSLEYFVSQCSSSNGIVSGH